ncbi:hypothetical protein D3C81_899560 [compost metagenome]
MEHRLSNKNRAPKVDKSEDFSNFLNSFMIERKNIIDTLNLDNTFYIESVVFERIDSEKIRALSFRNYKYEGSELGYIKSFKGSYNEFINSAPKWIKNKVTENVINYLFNRID